MFVTKATPQVAFATYYKKNDMAHDHITRNKKISSCNQSKLAFYLKYLSKSPQQDRLDKPKHLLILHVSIYVILQKCISLKGKKKKTKMGSRSTKIWGGGISKFYKMAFFLFFSRINISNYYHGYRMIMVTMFLEVLSSISFPYVKKQILVIIQLMFIH